MPAKKAALRLGIRGVRNPLFFRECSEYLGREARVAFCRVLNAGSVDISSLASGGAERVRACSPMLGWRVGTM